MIRAAQWTLGLSMAVIIWASFLWASPAQNFVGQSSRIVFYHVPMAWVSTIAFFLAAWHSAVYLRKRRMEGDDAAASAPSSGPESPRRKKVSSPASTSSASSSPTTASSRRPPSSCSTPSGASNPSGSQAGEPEANRIVADLRFVGD